jgi:6-phosphogluconate dehydrogenase
MSNRTIEKTEKQSAEQAVEEPIIEKTDIKESVEELNDVRKITIL